MFCSILFLGISVSSLYNAPLDQINDLVKYSAAFGIVMHVFWSYEIKPKEEEKRKIRKQKNYIILKMSLKSAKQMIRF